MMRIQTDDVDWQPKDAEEALKTLEKVTSRLHEHSDARAVFLDVYLVVTRRVVQILKADDADGFLEPAWLSHLTGLFAEEALLAVLASLRGEPMKNAAWRFATHYAAHGITRPCNDAVLGVSAHINYDLGLVTYDSIVSHGAATDAARLRRYEHDFYKVNEILKASIPECLDLLVERYRCPTTQGLLRIPLFRPVLSGAVMHTLRVWRDRVWKEIEEMLETESLEAHRAIVARIDHRAGRIAQLICTGDALRLLLRGEPPPFRLSRPADTWLRPGAASPVSSPAGSERSKRGFTGAAPSMATAQAWAAVPS
jgi:hypothetical protein